MSKSQCMQVKEAFLPLSVGAPIEEEERGGEASVPWGEGGKMRVDEMPPGRNCTYFSSLLSFTRCISSWRQASIFFFFCAERRNRNLSFKYIEKYFCIKVPKPDEANNLL